MSANLREANLASADLRGTILMMADLSGADMRGTEIAPGDRDHLIGTDGLLYPYSLKGTKLWGVIGLTKEQLEACKAKGAVIDVGTTTSPPQSLVSPSPSAQSDGAQAPSAPSVQGSIPTPDTGSSVASLKPDPKS